MEFQGPTVKSQDLTMESQGTTLECKDSTLESQGPKGKFQAPSVESRDPVEDKEGPGVACSGNLSRLEVTGLDSLTQLLHRPCDPASLATIRIMFGLLMVLDVPQERGMSIADIKWGDPTTCRFPLLHGLTPLPFNFMVLLYALMVFCAGSMALGWRWRASCGIFVLCYWYLFLLDKATWNNHTYLYGLLSTVLLVSDPHRCWSLDGRLRCERASHVPLWTYVLLRTQIFLLYFLAGIKKFNADWVGGYSMRNLGQHWVFTPFRFVCGIEWVDYYMVHVGGLALDLTLGPLLLHSTSRPFAFIPAVAFHLLNSQIFTIGMFPWVCLATLPVFCNHDWPRRLLASLTGHHKPQLPLVKNPSCFYSGESKVTWQQHGRTVLVIGYILLQVALPFSHSITKGYNTWTEGAYGYSWDMMVHSWDTLHIRVTVTQFNGNKLYLNPKTWVQSERWSSHADMAVQYSRCVKDRLTAQGINISAIHLDVWKSLNGRFQQRVFDPTVNILEAPWSPWLETSWVLPVVTTEAWLEHLHHLYHQATLISPYTERVFVADFPGLTLDTYLSDDLENVTLEVLKGEVMVPLPQGTTPDDLHLDGQNHSNFTRILHTWKNICSANEDEYKPLENQCQRQGFWNDPIGMLKGGMVRERRVKDTQHTLVLGTKDRVVLPNGCLHYVTTTSTHPAFYMFTFTNSTINKEGANTQAETLQGEANTLKNKKNNDKNQELDHYFPTLKDFIRFLQQKVLIFYRSGMLFFQALSCLLSNTCMIAM